MIQWKADGVNNREIGRRLGISEATVRRYLRDLTAPFTEEDREFLKNYGGNVDYTDRSAIKPIIDYIRAK